MSSRPLQPGDYVEVLNSRGLTDDRSYAGRRGYVMHVFPSSLITNADHQYETRLVVQLDGDSCLSDIFASSVFKYKDEHDSYLTQLVTWGPQNLDGIFMEVHSDNPFPNSFYHRAARDLDTWYNEEDIARLLNNDEYLKTLRYRMMAPIQVVTNWIDNERSLDNVVFSNNPHFCLGCISIRELPDFVMGREVKKIPISAPEVIDNDLRDTLHFATTAMELTCSLLLRQDTDKLLLQLTSPLDSLTGREMLAMNMKFSALHFPKVAELAASVLALCMIRNPIAVLESQSEPNHEIFFGKTVLDRIVFIGERLNQVLTTPNVRPTIFVEAHYAAKLSIDLLPLLFHLGGWRQHKEELHTALAIKIYRLLQALLMAFQFHGDECDCELDIKSYPAMAHMAPVFMAPLLVCDDDDPGDRSWRQTLLKERPLSFVIAGLVEVLGWWGYKDREFYLKEPEGFYSSMEDLNIGMHLLASKTPRLSHIPLITRTFANRARPGVPSRKQSLLYGPLCFQHRRCGLLSCRKTAEEAGGTLLRCAGGCDGLEQYCCREHQSKHWKMHKGFCKGRKKTVDSRAGT